MLEVEAPVAATGDDDHDDRCAKNSQHKSDRCPRVTMVTRNPT